LHRQAHLDFGKPLPFGLNRVGPKEKKMAPSNATLFDYSISLSALVTDTLRQQRIDLLKSNSSQDKKTEDAKEEPKSSLEEEVQAILSQSLTDNAHSTVISQPTQEREVNSKEETPFQQSENDNEKMNEWFTDELPPRPIGAPQLLSLPLSLSPLTSLHISLCLFLLLPSLHLLILLFFTSL
jgi:hypothetical protein